jgi:capsular polysaccharide biosynthesis protein
VTGTGRRVTDRVRSAARRLEARYYGPQVARLVRDCAPLLPNAPRRRRVVILVSAARRREVALWLAHFRRDRVLVVGEGASRRRGVAARRVTSLDAIHDALRRFGAVHILIDLRSEDVAQYRETWERLAFHLEHGGVFLLRRRSSERRAGAAALTAWAAELARPGAGESRQEQARANATAGVALLENAFAVVKKGFHFLAVSDDEVDDLLPARERGMSVDCLLELPGGELESRVQVTSYESGINLGGLADRMPYPRMRLRHYTGPVSFAGRTLMFTGRSILPDSYRFYRAETLDHPVTRRASDDFHTIPAAHYPKQNLDGDFYVLDPQWTGHFGHIMTEVVGRLWAWDEAKSQYPDLKVLFAVARGRYCDPLLSRIVSAYGIPESDLVAVDHPVRVNSVLAATTMWHNYRPHFAHPAITEVWSRIARNLVDPCAPAWERIFVSRSGSIRARSCHNAAEVEQLFEDYGFTVVYPEELDLSTQAGIFASARVIAGFGGSGLFNLMYAEKLEHLILLSHEAYSARNEHLYSSLIGGSAHYFWSAPDIPQNIGSYNWRAFVSDWSFDFARNRANLEKVLSTV